MLNNCIWLNFMFLSYLFFANGHFEVVLRKHLRIISTWINKGKKSEPDYHIKGILNTFYYCCIGVWPVEIKWDDGWICISFDTIWKSEWKLELKQTFVSSNIIKTIWTNCNTFLELVKCLGGWRRYIEYTSELFSYH